MKSNNNFSVFCLLALFSILNIIISCKKESAQAKIPTLITLPITDVTLTTAVTGGNISSDGGEAITDRGICWSAVQNPTIADSITKDGYGIGSFSSSVKNLRPGNTYYICAYATNIIGTGYGEIFKFSTKEGVIDIDGNEYHSVKIGNQVWMVENLEVTHYRNGDCIPYITDSATWRNIIDMRACSDLYADPASCEVYGKLYNWHAVNDNRILAPDGWHIPTNDEWRVLVNYLGGNDIAGGKLKEAGTQHWLSPNLAATNESGFTALPGGAFGGYGEYSYLDKVEGYWWTSDISYYYDAKSWYLLSNSDWAYSSQSYQNNGFSVRCVKD